VRKLQASDRLVGAANLAWSTGRVPTRLAWGIAAALCFAPADDPAATEVQTMLREKGTADTLRSLTGIEPSAALGRAVLVAYETLCQDPRAECPG
jgi:mannitol-1-phosphate 5-dehydrogenase